MDLKNNGFINKSNIFEKNEYKDIRHHNENVDIFIL